MGNRGIPQNLASGLLDRRPVQSMLGVTATLAVSMSMRPFRPWQSEEGTQLAGFLRRRNNHERAAFQLYGAAVAAARDPYLYETLGVPDTLDGRFDAIALHVYLLVRRLNAEPEPGPALAQAVFDAMFLDMDINLREMGVGDLSVSKRNRAMWEAFHGRSAAYAAAWNDPAALAGWPRAQLLARRGTSGRILGGTRTAGTCPDPQILAEQDLATMLKGEVTFLPAEEAAR